MTSCPTLLTDRLVLRPFRSEDAEPLFAAMSTPEVRAALHVPDDFSPADAWRSLTLFAGLWELKGLGQWALEERPPAGSSAGPASTGDPSEDWPGVEVGWMLDPAHWGSGYATEAGARSVRYGFDELGEDTLFSCILGRTPAPRPWRGDSATTRGGADDVVLPVGAARAVATRPTHLGGGQRRLRPPSMSTTSPVT